MLRKEDFAVIKSLNNRGVFLKDIAEELGVHPKTVSRALKNGGRRSRTEAPRKQTGALQGEDRPTAPGKCLECEGDPA